MTTSSAMDPEDALLIAKRVEAIAKNTTTFPGQYSTPAELIRLRELGFVSKVRGFNPFAATLQPTDLDYMTEEESRAISSLIELSDTRREELGALFPDQYTEVMAHLGKRDELNKKREQRAEFVNDALTRAKELLLVDPDDAVPVPLSAGSAAEVLAKVEAARNLTILVKDLVHSATETIERENVPGNGSALENVKGAIRLCAGELSREWNAWLMYADSRSRDEERASSGE